MKSLAFGAVVASALSLGVITYAQSMHSEQASGPMSSTMMHGGRHSGHMWPMGPGWHGPGPMPRHHMAMMWGIPQPYATLTNPLPRSQATLESGARVYADNCESCHGKQGLGDGPAGRDISPPPGNLAWLSDMPMGQWDPFIYWTIAEGGAQFGTAMPAFKDSLTKDEIWAVTAYIQAHLPQKSDTK